jgi:4-methylaminobutanoate oxidase (formaldehyde-forming)
LQQLIVTEMVPGVRPDLPMVRIMDAAVYMRPCQDGLLWGVYEEEPTFFDMDEFSPTFRIADLKLDAEILWRAAEDVKAQLPILLKAKMREHRGGIPTMTSDGHHIVGPVPGAEGFFALSGCNVAGLSISPALGDAVAAWISEGEPPFDLSLMSISRFGPEAQTEAWLRKNAAWQYRHFYGAV